MTIWTRWLRQPQGLWIRRALFQVHLWTGIAFGLYIFIVCVTGSVVVYRGELYRAATPDPVIVAGSGPRLTTDELTQAAIRAYPGFEVTRVFSPRNPDRAVTIALKRGPDVEERLFHPFTGEDLGDSVPWGFHFVSWLVDLHDNLLMGSTGRALNGAGALLLTLLTMTGLVIWWPGIAAWRRSLLLRRNVGWKRVTWDLHSAVGFWTFGICLLFGVTGVYLGYPEPFHAVGDYFEPLTDDNGGTRVVDTATFWLARLHFGRFGGWSTKLVWAILGLAPAVMFVTGAVMWWNRVLCKVFREAGKPEKLDLAKEASAAR
jgi:uncharacterized iron-regulated membrane protein